MVSCISRIQLTSLVEKYNTLFILYHMKFLNCVWDCNICERSHGKQLTQISWHAKSIKISSLVNPIICEKYSVWFCVPFAQGTKNVASTRFDKFGGTDFHFGNWCFLRTGETCLLPLSVVHLSAFNFCKDSWRPFQPQQYVHTSNGAWKGV